MYKKWNKLITKVYRMQCVSWRPCMNINQLNDVLDGNLTEAKPNGKLKIFYFYINGCIWAASASHFGQRHPFTLTHFNISNFQIILIKVQNFQVTARRLVILINYYLKF